MRIQHLQKLVLCLPALALCGCDSRSDASPSTSPVGVPREQQQTGAPTLLIPEREPLTPIEVALGLDHEVSIERMREIAARVRKEGQYCGQGCGMSGITEDGKKYGAFWDEFVIKLADGEKAEGITLGYLQNEVGFYSLDGNGFEYQLRKGVFYREERPKRK